MFLCSKFEKYAGFSFVYNFKGQAVRSVHGHDDVHDAGWGGGHPAVQQGHRHDRSLQQGGGRPRHHRPISLPPLLHAGSYEIWKIVFYSSEKKIILLCLMNFWFKLNKMLILFLTCI